MELRAFGSTGLVVSRIGLGMAALGRPGYINLEHAQDLAQDYQVAVMQQRAYQVLDVAWDTGIRYFDAARSYGLGEQFLGTWLASRVVSPESVTVGSKWGYTYTADWRVQAQAHEIKEHTLATLQRQWRETVASLDGYVKLYQIHSATVQTRVVENRSVLEELARLKSAGVHIGLTSSGPEQSKTVRQAIGIKMGGSRLFDSVQVTWNLLEPSAGPALMEAHAAGMGVIIKEALANGRLTERNKDNDFASKLAVLRGAAEKFGTSIDALVLAVCLAQPFADVVLSGATTVEQVSSNARAGQLRIEPETVAHLSQLAEPSATYWATRSRLPWN